MTEDRKRSIFVIDDEEPVRKVLNTHLKKEGYHVTASRGGRGVFSELNENPFELLICDIKMPDVGGLDILEYVKSNFSTVPVIMLTGLTDVSMAVDVMKKGAFDYLMKPVRKLDLFETIRRALVYRDLLVRNSQLEHENREYQKFLEKRVRERTRELRDKNLELGEAYSHLKSMNLKFVNVLAETIEAKDRHTRGHCNRMRDLCVDLGKLVGLSSEEMEILEYASVLHDIGKIGVNELILNKQGPLDAGELEHVRVHPEIGERILQGIPLMERVAEIVVTHHENYNGSGYPRGLKGKEIPLCARIIAVADLYDAMSNDRPYRKGFPPERIIDEMKRVSGTQLDPGIVDIFINNIDGLVENPARASSQGEV
ncbi:MAG: response regulator [Thermodesulfobacteriota bacterium]|nr:MAG: response regulator [Thermodesulfobacteriota bacterium]